MAYQSPSEPVGRTNAIDFFSKIPPRAISKANLVSANGTGSCWNYTTRAAALTMA
jgi:hypothetical protein